MSKNNNACTVYILLVLLWFPAIASLECFSCLNITDPSHCNKTIFCKTDEICYQDTVMSGQAKTLSLGCVNVQQCRVQNVAPSGPGRTVGRNITKRQDDRCYECCGKNRCNVILCARNNPAACVDDGTVDCPRMHSVFGICNDTQHAKSLCPKFCSLCDVVDGEWAEWTQWSICDVTCENGTQSRTRTCTNPAPAHGGLECKGSNVENKQCHRPLCPVDGGWSNWSDWGSCSSTCDVGLQRRQRTCTNPVPLRYGNHCFGLNMDDRLCRPGPCASPVSVVFRSKELKSQSLTDNQTLVFSTTTLNEGNGYDNTTGIFTAPMSGTYWFSLQLCVYGGQNMYYAFIVNNFEIKRGWFTDHNWTKCYTADTVAVVKYNDRVYIKSRGPCSLYKTNACWDTFSGVLVHA